MQARRILDYQNLQGYLIDLYQHEGIAETVNFEDGDVYERLMAQHVKPESRRSSPCA